MLDAFEPIVVYDVHTQGNDVVLKTGFYIHFKKQSWFKAKIEKGAKEENHSNLILTSII